MKSTHLDIHRNIMKQSGFFSRTITIGALDMGGGFPVRVQSMTNTPTMDTLSTMRQVERMVLAGCELVRITARNVSEARNLANIKKELHATGINVPLIADIHFNPEAALVAAQIVDKVRINPGNYADRIIPGKAHKAFSDAEYQSELDRIAERLHPLINLCMQEGTAIRVGTNHGSLSQRILDRYGNTPNGMVESAMEFVRILSGMGFQKLVLSMKSSDIHVMLQSYRLLAERMLAEHFDYPLHLGVTEAGAGEDGIVKSACGIGPLLAEGLGDTIRVSLTGAPESELPAAKHLVALYAAQRLVKPGQTETNGLSGASLSTEKMSLITEWHGLQDCDFLFSAHGTINANEQGRGVIIPAESWKSSLQGTFPLFASAEAYLQSGNHSAEINFIYADKECVKTLLSAETKDHNIVLIVDAHQPDAPSIFTEVLNGNAHWKYAVKVQVAEGDATGCRVKWAALASQYLDPRYVDFLWLSGGDQEGSYQTSLAILQSHGLRRTKAEFVSCPSCGRTEFDIESVLEQVKKATSHLTHLKIAVMGCIVNGPGEMADADYGCVGMGKKEVALYKYGKVALKHILEDDVVTQLCDLIKSSGDWKDPE